MLRRPAIARLAEEMIGKDQTKSVRAYTALVAIGAPGFDTVLDLLKATADAALGCLLTQVLVDAGRPLEECRRQELAFDLMAAQLTTEVAEVAAACVEAIGDLLPGNRPYGLGTTLSQFLAGGARGPAVAGRPAGVRGRDRI